jgi:hypothetical protein
MKKLFLLAFLFISISSFSQQVRLGEKFPPLTIMIYDSLGKVTYEGPIRDIMKNKISVFLAWKDAFPSCQEQVNYLDSFYLKHSDNLLTLTMTEDTVTDIKRKIQISYFSLKDSTGKKIHTRDLFPIVSKSPMLIICNKKGIINYIYAKESVDIQVIPDIYLYLKKQLP